LCGDIALADDFGVAVDFALEVRAQLFGRAPHRNERVLLEERAVLLSTAFFTAAFSVATISLEVAAGAYIANQLSATSPDRLAFIVGSSGNAATGFSVVTARARTFPARICGTASSASANRKSTSPLRRASIAGPPPL
jgi:hypothetical protein